MAFAILRTAKLKTAGNLGGLNGHLTRSKEVPNADKELFKYNSRPIGSADLWKDVQARIQEAGITKIRKDGVLAVEHLITASPEHFDFNKKVNEKGQAELWGQTARWKAFEKASIEWLQDRYGKENLVNVMVHKDEQTPHLHAVVVPIQNGKLNCKSYLGGREKLREMQSSFAEKVKDQGLERGIKGSKAHHTTVKEFYGQAKNFEKAPSLQIEVSAPVASIQAPETNLFGQMKLDPQEYAKVQEKRLQAQLAAHHQQTLLKAQDKAVQLHKAAQVAEVLKLENQRLKGQIQGLQKQVATLTADLYCSHDLVKVIGEKKFTPDQIHQALNQVAKTEAAKSMQECLKLTGMKVKEPEPEIKYQVRRSKGYGL